MSNRLPNNPTGNRKVMLLLRDFLQTKLNDISKHSRNTLGFIGNLLIEFCAENVEEIGEISSSMISLMYTILGGYLSSLMSNFGGHTQDTINTYLMMKHKITSGDMDNVQDDKISDILKTMKDKLGEPTV